jgi:hypothetical protein
MRPYITTAPIATSSYAPLVALGFWLRHYDLFSPIRSRVQFTHPTHTTDPVAALLDLLVGLLAGCEVVAQVNTTIRSDRLLAQAWGRDQFVEQSTIARVLDACGPTQLAQWRQANDATLRWIGQVYRHPFLLDWLRLDIDLTALRASAHAEGSQKGYFPGKKTPPDANWDGLPQSTIAKCYSPTFFPVRRQVRLRSRRCSKRSSGSCRSVSATASVSCCAWMLGLVPIAT